MKTDICLLDGNGQPQMVRKAFFESGLYYTGKEKIECAIH